MKYEPNIKFRLNSREGVAPYRQLIEQVKQAIQIGQLKSGDQLPPVRQVITQITINPNTVYRAYRELEHLGIVETQWGVGTFIKSSDVEGNTSGASSSIAELISHWISGARSIGASDDQIMEIVRSALLNTIRVDT